MSDQNQILRLLGTIREECSDIRNRQEELYELLISYKDQVHDLKRTVVEGLAGLPKSPYIAGQLVPAPGNSDGVDDLHQLLSVYLHKNGPDPLDDGGPVDAVYEPAPEVKPEDIQLEAGEAPRPRRGRKERDHRPRDMDLQRGPDRDVEPLDLNEPDDKDKPRGGGGRRRRRRRGTRGKQEASSESPESAD